MKERTYSGISENAVFTDGKLLCPDCGNDYIHLGKAFSFMDEEKRFRTIIETEHCEHCGMNKNLCIFNHKGNTVIEWFDKNIDITNIWRI